MRHLAGAACINTIWPHSTACFLITYKWYTASINQSDARGVSIKLLVGLGEEKKWIYGASHKQKRHERHAEVTIHKWDHSHVLPANKAIRLFGLPTPAGRRIIAGVLQTGSDYSDEWWQADYKRGWERRMAQKNDENSRPVTRWDFHHRMPRSERAPISADKSGSFPLSNYPCDNYWAGGGTQLA